MANCNKLQKRKLQKLDKRMYRICFDFIRGYFGVSLFFTKDIAKFYRAKFGQTRFETSQEWRNQQMYHPLVAMETGFTSCNGVLAKHKELGTRNYVWTQIVSQGWKNQTIKKIYVRLLAKTEEMV